MSILILECILKKKLNIKIKKKIMIYTLLIFYAQVIKLVCSKYETSPNVNWGKRDFQWQLDPSTCAKENMGLGPWPSINDILKYFPFAFS